MGYTLSFFSHIFKPDLEYQKLIQIIKMRDNISFFVYLFNKFHFIKIMVDISIEYPDFNK